MPMVLKASVTPIPIPLDCVSLVILATIVDVFCASRPTSPLRVTISLAVM